MRCKNGSLVTRDLTWAKQDETIRFNPPPGTTVMSRNVDMMAASARDDYAMAAAAMNDDKYTVGAKKSYVPELGPVISREPEECPFDSYVYQAPNGKRVGVIRIGTYAIKDPVANAKAFTALVQRYRE